MNRVVILLLLAVIPFKYATSQTLTKLSSDASKILVGEVVALQVEIDPRPDGQPWCGLEINFGDGNNQVVRVGENGLKDIPVKLTHTYADPGEYFVLAEGKSIFRGLRSAGPCSGTRQQLKILVESQNTSQTLPPTSTKPSSESKSITRSSAKGSTKIATKAKATPLAKTKSFAVTASDIPNDSIAGKIAETPVELPTSAPQSVEISQVQTPAAPLQALDTCMNKTMARGAMIGSIAGGVLGALFGGNDKGKGALIGASLGAAAGGAIAWQGSYKSCSDNLNLASASSRMTGNYRDTAKRYQYKGDGNVLKIEGVNVPLSVNAGQTLEADLTYALLTPDAAEADVQVARTFKCGNTEIPIQQEKYKVPAGTVVSTGKIQIPSLANGIGEQSCTMWVGVAAAGKQDEWQGSFVITPNQN